MSGNQHKPAEEILSFLKLPLHMQMLIGYGILPIQSKLVFFGAEKVGKCLHKDSNVWASGKGLVRISEIVDGDRILTTSGKPRTCSILRPKRISRQVSIRTYRGFELTGSDEHRVLCCNYRGGKVNWKSLNKISTDDRVLIRCGGKIFGEDSVQEPYIAGLLIGDGTIRKGQLGFTNSDTELVNHLRIFFGDDRKEVYRKTSTCLYINGQENVKRLLNKCGIKSVAARADKKFVPAPIRHGSAECQRQFLRGLFDTDGGWIGKGKIEYSSASEQLSLEVQLMLLNFGILARRSRKYVKGRIYYRIYFGGYDAERFNNEIGFGMQRKQLEYKRTRTALRELEKEKRALWIGDESLIWDRITDIHNKEVPTRFYAQFYDLSMLNSSPDFLVNGIVTHNSIICGQTGLDLACGQPFLGFIPIEGTHRVLYVQGEISEPGLQKRFRKQLTSYPMYKQGHLFKLTDFDLKVNTPEGFAVVQQEIEKVRPEILILDPLQKFMAGDDNSSEVMQGFCDSVDRLIWNFGISVIVAHHSRKASAGRPYLGAQEARGHSKLIGWADSIIGIRGDFFSSKLAMWFELRHAEFNVSELEIALDREHLRFNVIEEASKSDKTKSLIGIQLSEGPATRKTLQEIVVEAGVSARTFATALDSLVKAEKIRETKLGTDKAFEMILSPEESVEAPTGGS